MDDKSIRRVGAGVITVDAVAMVNIGTPEFITHTVLLITIPDHLESCLAHGDAILSNGIGVLVFEVNAATLVQVNDSGYGVSLAKLIYGHDIMSRIQKGLRDVGLLQECLHGVVGITEAKRIVHGCPVQQREYRQIAI
jgi:hypothetical protein